MTSNLRLVIGLGGAALAVMLPAPASTAMSSQPAARSDAQVITLEGERFSPAAARAQATEFVRTLSVASGETPAARWVDPICPRVQGLEEVGRVAAEAKVRSSAAAAGVPVAPEGCKPNIVIAFTDDAPGVTRAIVQRDPWRISGASVPAREALLKGAAPIRWMYSTEVRGRSGENGTEGSGAAATIPGTYAGSGGGSPLGGDKSMMRYESSIVSTLTNRVLTSVIVIVDTDDVMGRRLDSLAAYAALVSVAEIRNAQAAPAGSILSLFSSPRPPRDLTAKDRAFLRALYRLPLDRKAMQHRSRLVQDISESLASGS